MNEQLKKIVAQLKEQLEESERSVAALKKAIATLEQSEPAQQMLSSEFKRTADNTEPTGPFEAVRSLFDGYPDRKWYPSEIRDHLQKLQSEGKLISKAEDLLSTAHNCIRMLHDKQYIIKGGKDTLKWYKLKHD